MCNCGGTIKACLKSYVGPCDAGINTGLSVPASGDYLIFLTLNGVATQMTLTVAADHPIVLPNVINNSAVYEMQVYDPSGDLLNDTCYSLKTIIALGNDSAVLPPSPYGKANKIITVAQDGHTITDVFFATNTILAITADTQTYLAGTDFTQTGASITGIIISFYVGQVIFAQT